MVARTVQRLHVSDPAVVGVMKGDPAYGRARRMVQRQPLHADPGGGGAPPPELRPLRRPPVHHVDAGRDRYLVATDGRHLSVLLLRAARAPGGAAVLGAGLVAAYEDTARVGGIV